MPRQATANSPFAFDPDQGAFLGGPEGRITVACGALEAQAEPSHDAPSFYAPDFFLRAPTPWWTPEHATRFVRRAEMPDAPDGLVVDWSEPDRDAYARVFESLRRHLDASTIQKATPVVFAEGRVADADRPCAPFLVAKAVAAPPPSIPFGLWHGDEGIAGATPELLFRITEDGAIETMALAGTSALATADALLDDPKERDEHQFVIDALLDALAPFGAVDVGETTVLRLPVLAHLHTPIRVPAPRDADFESLTAALHPTPALGGTPRDAAVRWLEARDSNVGRGRFGAPFGLRHADGSGMCVVAVRAVTWRGRDVRLGAGAGVIAASRFEREWEELGRKRDAVKRMFGL